MSSEILGPNSHVFVYAESAWGTKPGTPVYVYLPVDSFGLKTQGQTRYNDPYTGGRFQKHAQAYNMAPSGQMGGKFHGYEDAGISESIAQMITDLAYGALADNESASIGVEWAQGPDTANKQFNGMRMDQLTIQGSAQSGVVEWNASFVGKNEVTLATAQTVPNDLEKLVDFQFCDMTLSIDSSAIKIASFQLQRSLNQKPKWLNSRTPNCIKVGKIVDTITFQFLKNANTYDTIQRAMASAGTMSEKDLDVVLLGNHNGTGTNTNTRLTIDIPRACITDIDDKLSADDVFEQGLTFAILKPDSSTSAVTLSYDTN